MKKNLLVIAISILAISQMFGQVPASSPDQLLSTLSASWTGFRHGMGSDIRSGNLYANYFRITATDYRTNNIAPATSSFFWDNSNGFNGALSIGTNVITPDVVLVSNSATIYALMVAFDRDVNRYTLRIATYNPLGTFTFAAPIVLESIVLGAKPTIQIDADNNGNFGIVWETRIGGLPRIRTLSGTTTVGGPIVNVAATKTFANSAIEPDIAISNNGAGSTEVNIVALTAARTSLRKSSYNHAAMTTVGPLPAISSPNYNSTLGGSYYMPRIACPKTGTGRNFSIVVQRNPVAGQTLIELHRGGPVTVLNNGTFGFPDLRAVINTTPVVSYTYNGLDEYTSVLWHSTNAGPGYQFAIIGMDILGGAPTTPTYEALSSLHTATSTEDDDAMALSGRYSDWAKSATFMRINSGGGATTYDAFWKLNSTGAPNWKPSGNETIAAENEYSISIFPNPTQSFFGINGNPKHNYLVNILDAKGSIIYRSSGLLTEINNNLKMNCPAAIGMYLVRIKDMETGQSTTEKLIKK